jgi:hypothetical protein
MTYYSNGNDNSTFTIRFSAEDEPERYATIEVNEHGSVSIVDGEKYTECERFAIIDIAEVTPQVRDAMEDGEQNYVGAHECYRQQVNDDWYDGKRGAC